MLVGLLVMLIGIAHGGKTGYAINPARDLGPRLAHAFLPIPGKGDSNWSYAWIPVLGPVLGGVYGALFYKAVFTAESGVTFWVVSVVVAAVFTWSLVGRNSQD